MNRILCRIKIQNPFHRRKFEKFEKKNEKMKVITLNLWCEQVQRRRRLREATDHLLELCPDVVFLQEIPQGDSRRYLKTRLSQRYAIVFSKNESTYPPLSYVPFVMVFLSMLLGFRLNLRKSLLASVLVSPRCVSILVSLALSRRVSDVDLMGTFASHSYEAYICKETRNAGTGILIKKEILRNNTITSISRPFDHGIRGYPLPKTLFPLRKWITYFLQHSFARPGCMLVRADTKEGPFIFANCHLVISRSGSVINRVREKQVGRVLKWIEDGVQNNHEGIVVAGDFNAVPQSGLEQKKMNQAGYVESFQDREIITWDPILNEYTRTSQEPQCQLDYVYINRNVLKFDRSRRVFDGSKEPIVSDHYGIEAEFSRRLPKITYSSI